ncbi:MAG TPA: hypothetical protein VJY34_22900 [Roseiarcus sp.]|nr:hypothetical protein [Roseiarcus sp.]
MATVLSANERALSDAYWRAVNYLSVGQIYPIRKKKHIKPRLRTNALTSRGKQVATSCLGEEPHLPRDAYFCLHAHKIPRSFWRDKR